MRFPFRSRTYTSVNAASPLAIGDAVFLTTSYRTGCVLVGVGGDQKGRVVWRSEALRAHFATPIHREGVIYGLDGSGSDTALVGVDAASGVSLWRHLPAWKRRVEQNGKVQEMTFSVGHGSLVLADGHFLCLGERGDLAWFELSRGGARQISRTEPFFAKSSWTPPVISRGLLYLCQNSADTVHKTGRRLLCFDLRTP